MVVESKNVMDRAVENVSRSFPGVIEWTMKSDKEIECESEEKDKV